MLDARFESIFVFFSQLLWDSHHRAAEKEKQSGKNKLYTSVQLNDHAVSSCKTVFIKLLPYFEVLQSN